MQKILRYARLFDSETKKYSINNNDADLIMGSETEKRSLSNIDNTAVTICCITYNHEDVIRDALEGFVKQKTNFKFKVFVGDDCSKDNTKRIIKEYEKKYPDIIVPFFRKKNMGAQSNLIDLCNNACSPYIAFCEGDDYWIDDYKLQKQFDYMQEHENIRMCYTRTEIVAPESWHLNSYYKRNKEGKMIIPECSPGFQKKKLYYVKDFVSVFPNHTSSAFYRWDYDLQIPPWYFKGLVGDIPITMLQMGSGPAVYLPDVTSVYRRSDIGVFMNDSDEDHFKNTRLDYVRFLSGLRDYFSTHFSFSYNDIINWRIRKEIYNYLNVAKDNEDLDMVEELLKLYPKEFFNSLHSYLGSFNIYSSFQRKLNKKDLFNLTKTRKGVLFCIPGLKIYSFLHSNKIRYNKLKEFLRNHIKGFYRFWKLERVPKDDTLWVFTSFRHRGYLDNSKYLFEYVVENHKEINPVWLTTDSKVYHQLQLDDKPVYYMNSKEGREIMAKASIAITDHFVMTDYLPLLSFNHGTKVVQLWHGVGFKSMGDEKGIKNTDVKGVKHSNDIIVNDTDNIVSKFIKRIKYMFLAPFRERFEEYFMFVCPGQERIDMIAKKWNIPNDRWFMSGHPRNINLYDTKPNQDTYKIIYAPTYRFNYQKEQEMINELLSNLEIIQKKMETINGEFTLRLHPHTWRNYKSIIKSSISPYNRILFDESKDIYETLGEYSLLISDYSSIALDFAMIDRPVVFHCFDFDWFKENEAGFDLDFEKVIPGPMTSSWSDTLVQIEKYYNDASLDKEKRRERCEYFFDFKVNDKFNSERIVNEIKRRLSMERGIKDENN